MVIKLSCPVLANVGRPELLIAAYIRTPVVYALLGVFGAAICDYDPHMNPRHTRVINCLQLSLEAKFDYLFIYLFICLLSNKHNVHLQDNHIKKNKEA